MLALVLAVLGVPVWIVVGMLLAGVYTRWRYRQQSDVFACYVRVVGGGPGTPRPDAPERGGTR